MQFRIPARWFCCSAAFAAVQAAFWLLPRASFSVNEKRVLAGAAPTRGHRGRQPFTEIDSYLSDHFPGRDALVGRTPTSQAEGRMRGRYRARGDGWLFPAPLAAAAGGTICRRSAFAAADARSI